MRTNMGNRTQRESSTRTRNSPLSPHRVYSVCAHVCVHVCACMRARLLPDCLTQTVSPTTQCAGCLCFPTRTEGRRRQDPGRTLRMMFKCEGGDSDERGQGGCLGREEEQVWRSWLPGPSHPSNHNTGVSLGQGKQMVYYKPRAACDVPQRGQAEGLGGTGRAQDGRKRRKAQQRHSQPWVPKRAGGE